MPSVFSRIIAGEIPCHRVASTGRWVAFLDINPVAPGHTLLVPVAEAPLLDGLDRATLDELGGFAARSIRAIKAVTGAPAVNLIVNDGPEAGQEIPHAHLHLIPRRAGDGQRIGLRHARADAADLAAMAARLAVAWSAP